MIVMFRGSDTSKNLSPQVLALYAAVNALKYNRRTLVLQFSRELPVEKVLRGKLDAEEMAFGGETAGFEDTGIDALMRRLDIKKFNKEHFDVCCRHMTKSENLLDIAGVSKKDDFEREVLVKQTVIKKLIAEGKKYYDDVFILGNNKNHEITDMLNRLCELSIICVPQGNKEEIYAPTTARETNDLNGVLYMIVDFDKNSSFDVGKMKKTYEVKKIAYLPYNTGFKDAYNSEAVLNFVLANTDIKDTDSNYDIFNAVAEVEKAMLGQDVPETEEFDLERLTRVIEEKDSEEEERQLMTLDASNVRYTKKYVGSIFKREVDGYEVNPDSFEDEAGLPGLVPDNDWPDEEAGYMEEAGPAEDYDDNWDGFDDDGMVLEEVDDDEDLVLEEIDDDEDMVLEEIEDDDEEQPFLEEVWEDEYDHEEESIEEEMYYERRPAKPQRKNKTLKRPKDMEEGRKKPARRR